ncbi:MAG: GatB/YqeY domain-containing protein [Oliverpabstia sp.]|nr:GatB/YqeY domain-containing protein [Eubacterium sp.]MCI6997209.1 GatB/YqeY domain-containing protein [Eubacterium sp.]MDY2593419.1 GatB/YqeY domain-containing protein [Oliverpabstia sp.]
MEFTKLQKDMVAAMKARDKVRKDAISSVISAVKKVAIDEGCRDNIDDALVDRVILKELKSVKEQIDTCPAERADLLEQYQARYDIINEYAPKLMSKEEVKACLQEKFAEVLATGNKGQIMKAVMAEMKGKADGKVINQAVAEICAANK